jgi:hypothetical protein
MIVNRLAPSILLLSFLPFVLLKNGWATSYALGYAIYITGLLVVSYGDQVPRQKFFHPKSFGSLWWNSQSISSLGFLSAVVLVLLWQAFFLPMAHGQRFVLSSLLALYFLLAASWFASLELPSIKSLQAFAKLFLAVHLLILLLYKGVGVLYIYPEPSHLALAVIPWFTLLFLSVRPSEKKWLFASLIVFAALSTNTTIVIYMLLALVWVRPPLVLIIAMVIYILFFNEQQLIERLSLNKAVFPCHTVIYEAARGYWSGCPNFVSTSTLVWLKGWHLAYLNLIETTGMGIGFQQLGYAGAYSMISESIQSGTAGGVDLNIRDGGSTAAKMISEMGLAGLLFLIYSLVIFVIYWCQVSSRNYFWIAAFVGGLFELYIRGYGYFTLNFVAYLAACLFFQQQVCQLQQKTS